MTNPDDHHGKARDRPTLVTVTAYLLWTQWALGFIALVGTIAIANEAAPGFRMTIANMAISVGPLVATVLLGVCAVMLLRRHRAAIWTAAVTELFLLLVNGFGPAYKTSLPGLGLALLVLLCLCHRAVRGWCRAAGKAALQD